MPISKHPALPWAATVFGTIFLGFGVNYMINPRAAFGTFGFPYPTTPADLQLMDSVMVLFGVKDVFMALSIWTATWVGNRKTAGLVLFAASLCAGADGYVVKCISGTGEWNHWGYGSVMGVVGLVMTGVLG